MSDFRARQRVQIHDGTDEFGVLVSKPIFVQLSDGVDGALIDGSGNLNAILAANSGVDIGDVDVLSIIPGTGATNLGKAEDAVHASGDVGIQALAVRQDADSAFGADGDYSPLQLNSNGALKVEVIESTVSGGGTEFAEDSVHSTGALGTLSLAVRNDTLATLTDTDGDYAVLQVDADGALYTTIRDGGNSITVDNVALSVVGGGVEATALRVTIASDSTGVLSIDDNSGSITVDDGGVNLNMDIAEQSLTALKISATAAANTELNPIFVQVVSTVTSGEEVQDFDTVAAVAKDGTSNHDYTVVGTTFLLKSVIVAASGAQKIEIQTGPIASLATKAVIFTSGAKPTEQVDFNPPIEVPVTSTGTVRLIRRNDDNQAMDVYSTIIGNDI